MNLNWLVISCVVAVVAACAQPAYAEYRKVGPDTRSAAQIAEDECAAQASGSTEVIAGSVVGGVIGMVVGRDMFIKDCMRDRGFEWQSQKKAQKPRRKGKAN